jgi:2-dehydropantoate 2-reductase
MNPCSIAVLGPGAVGGFLAVVLSRAGCTVTCVAREGTCEVINELGIVVESRMLGKVQERVNAVAELTESVDVLIVSPKAPALDVALERIKAPCRTVVPLLNGLDHMEVIHTRIAGALGAGAIYIESVQDAPGRINHLSEFCRLEISRELPSHILEPLTAALEGQGIAVKSFQTNAEVLWRKLVPLNALACTTSAAGGNMGMVRSDSRWLEALQNCVTEGAAVAGALGIQVPVDNVLETFEKLPDSFSSSMQRDLAAGRPAEVDAIPGSLLREAARAGVECHTIKVLVDQIRSNAAVLR